MAGNDEAADTPTRRKQWPLLVAVIGGAVIIGIVGGVLVQRHSDSMNRAAMKACVNYMKAQFDADPGGNYKHHGDPDKLTTPDGQKVWVIGVEATIPAKSIDGTYFCSVNHLKSGAWVPYGEPPVTPNFP